MDKASPEMMIQKNKQAKSYFFNLRLFFCNKIRLFLQNS